MKYQFQNLISKHLEQQLKKKIAKHIAAANLLLSMSLKAHEKSLAQKVNQPPIRSTDSLQKLCEFNKWQTKVCTYSKQNSHSHCVFECICSVFVINNESIMEEIKTDGVGVSIELSKQEAAKKMHQTLVKLFPDCMNPVRNVTENKNATFGISMEVSKPEATQEMCKTSVEPLLERDVIKNKDEKKSLWKREHIKPEIRFSGPFVAGYEDTEDEDEEMKPMLKREQIKPEIRFTGPIVDRYEDIKNIKQEKIEIFKDEEMKNIEEKIPFPGSFVDGDTEYGDEEIKPLLKREQIKSEIRFTGPIVDGYDDNKNIKQEKIEIFEHEEMKNSEKKIENAPITNGKKIGSSQESLLRFQGNETKIISEFHNSLFNTCGYDARGAVLDGMRKLVFLMVTSKRVQEPNFIDYYVNELDTVMAFIGVEVNQTYFRAHDGSFIMLIHVSTIPEIVEIETSKEKVGLGMNAFCKVVSRIKELLE